MQILSHWTTREDPGYIIFHPGEPVGEDRVAVGADDDNHSKTSLVMKQLKSM